MRGDRAAIADQRTRHVLDLALKLTRTPSDVREHDVERLRDLGLSDAAAHDVVSITAYFNFVNRIAMGLGVELEAVVGASRDDDDDDRAIAVE